jgi:flagellar biosynthesis/type III secretory pathway chaperone
MTGGSDPLDELTEVLKAQAAELRGLLPLLDAQQAALTRADSACVAETMLSQEPALRRLLRLDQKRQALAKALAARLGAGTGPVSLSALLARLPAPPAAITAVQSELRELLGAVDVRNRRNAFLLERAVAFIDGLVRMVLAPAPEPAPVYAATGHPVRRRVGPARVDRRA